LNNSSKKPFLGPNEPFGGAVKNLDTAFSNVTDEQPMGNELAANVNSMALEINDPNLLATYELPKPAVFNEMAAEERTKILSALPNNVKNKYEYFCWSYKLNQLYNERPTVAN